MKSQKTQIVVQTLVPFSVTFGIICLLLSGNSVDDLITKWEKVLALGFLALGIALLQDLIPKSVKEFLVFWRRRERAAGHRAFSKARRYSSIIDREEVVDIEIRESLTPKHQDRLFYVIYDKYRDKGNISHYSFRYLQWRELASISILSGIVGYIFVSFNRGMLDIHSIFAMGIGAAFYVASVFAARNSANLLVDYVLLAETIEKNGGRRWPIPMTSSKSTFWMSRLLPVAMQSRFEWAQMGCRLSQWLMAAMPTAVRRS